MSDSGQFSFPANQELIWLPAGTWGAAVPLSSFGPLPAPTVGAEAVDGDLLDGDWNRSVQQPVTGGRVGTGKNRRAGRVQHGTVCPSTSSQRGRHHGNCVGAGVWGQTGSELSTGVGVGSVGLDQGRAGGHEDEDAQQAGQHLEDGQETVKDRFQLDLERF